MADSDEFLFEVSWEVCNKVGGIYTVISSKAREAVNTFGDNYITIGPLLQTNSGFREEDDPRFTGAIQTLAKKNIPVKTGTWEIDGSPGCILVDFTGACPDHDKLLFRLWEDFGVDSMFGNWEYIEPVLFSTACGIVIEHLSEGFRETHQVHAHFHEWIGGAGLLHLKKNVPEIDTVFTTHATVLGRAMSGSGVDIYPLLDEIDPASEAKRHNISAKYSLESVCAREADCFNAVSDLTAREASAFLGVKPAKITPNGFNVGEIPDFAQNREPFNEARGKLLDFSSGFLNRELKADKTKILSISGRYEFRNKGIDVFIESLNRLNSMMKEEKSDIHIVSLFLVMGGNVGVQHEARVRLHHVLSGTERYADISTHHLGDAQNDPILKACRRYSLTNNADDRCSIIFIPVPLDGNDGVINMPYYEVLSGCDIGVFPSYYEPWGYTPLESLAHAVPAITTDRAGFGIWIKDHTRQGRKGAAVIPRMDHDFDVTVNQLTDLLDDWTEWDTNTAEAQKKGARAIAEKADWKHFYTYYLESYREASSSRDIRLKGMQEEAKEPGLFFPGTNSASPRFRAFTVVSELPEAIKRLRELAHNLWCAWNRGARMLFRDLDPSLWNSVGHNPVALLESLGRKKLEQAASDKEFIDRYNSVLREFDEYLEGGPAFPGIPHITPERPAAYFSMEFGLHESIPTYSGGLGVLSGDHIKSASDLNIPLTGISLLYKYGYFSQRINKNNEQVTVYTQNKFSQMPIEIVRQGNADKVTIDLDFPGRTVKAQAWKASAGRAALYFLDTDVEENSPRDREITDKLYDAETRERIEQEIVLGIGGARLLDALGIEPSVYHLNEGHSAFLLIERIVHLMKDKGLDFDTAREIVQGSTIFTTHTPVPAGIEKFDRSLVENFFRNYIQQSGLQWDQFWNLGHVYAGDDSPFDMTACALKLSCKRNGVSRLHGKVSRNMWKNLWNGLIPEEIPITHITNGVHAESWVADEIKQLYESHAEIDWNSIHTGDPGARIHDIPDAELWKVHNRCKNRLSDRVKSILQKNWTREGEDLSLWQRLRARINPNALTIGFARRFASYKRPALLLTDIERLKELVSAETRPVQFIFSGKAHPADKAGAELIKQIVDISKQDDFLGKVIFLENYDMQIARLMVAGVDVWLNTPVRPFEASGTSGMKAAMNGVLNCSILDGWWDEACNGKNGWAIGKGDEYENRETQNVIDAEHMFSVLENHVIPLFYSRDSQELPVKWLNMMKHSMASVLPVYNTHRMITDYAEKMYEPAGKRHAYLTDKEYSRAKELAAWKKKIANRFSTLSIQSVSVEGIQGDIMNANSSVLIRAAVSRGSLQTDEIHAEAVVQDLNNASSEPFVFRKKMDTVQSEDTRLVYETTFKPRHTGRFRYGVRIMPAHKHLGSTYETGLVVWS